jgi:cellulose biosynthesis protein BcsQ
VNELPQKAVLPTEGLLVSLPQTDRLTTTQISINQEDSSMIILSIYHNKGGVGKSTVAVNTAAGFSSQGYRVLLIDLDAQANSTFATGLIKYQFDEDSDLKDRNVSHIIESEDLYSINEIKRRSSSFNNPEIDVIPSHLSLIEKIYKLNQKQVVCFLCLHSKLQAVKDQYDIVIIDTPPSRDLYAQVALVVSDYLIIPSDMKAFSNQGLNNVKNFLAELEAPRKFISKKPLQILGVLPSKILNQPQYVKHTFPKEVQTVIDRYGLPVLSSAIFQRTSLSKCLNSEIEMGDLRIPDPKSIFFFDPACESSQEFLSLIEEVSKKIGI